MIRRKDARSNKQMIQEIFAGTRVKATYQPNMGDYLQFALNAQSDRRQAYEGI